MTKRALPLLTGGLNEIGRSDLIDNSQLQKCQNYEIDGDGTLARRTEPEQFDASLDVLLGTLYASVLYISEPWYPQALRSYSGETRSDYFLFAYGQDSSNDYKLHILWDKNGTWIEYIENDNGVDEELELSTLLTEAGIVYTSSSEVEVTIATDKVIVTDGVNRAHFIALDEDGIVRAGILGIPAPTNKARVTEMTTWREELWETDSTASKLSNPGLFQCTYTVVTKTGEESNPAPISDTLDMQFFKLDEDGLDAKWLDKVEIKDLSIPDIPKNILDTLKYFKVYMRVIRNSAGEDTATLEFTERFEIVLKKDSNGNILTSGTTGNNYTLLIQVTAGEISSYENDIAPIAKTSAEIGGIAMVGNVKTKIRFPWEFKYFHKIGIKNSDSKHYVDAVIKIRLWDKNSTETDAIENFTLLDFIYNDNYRFKGAMSKHIRIFDQDMTTPIMVTFNGCMNPGNSTDINVVGTEKYIDLYIKIPLLTAAVPHFIYLCWTPDDDIDNYSGVPIDYNAATGDGLSWSENIGIHYGRFHMIGINLFDRQQVFTGERVTSSNSILCTPINVIMQDDRIENKANMNYSGTLNSHASIDDGTILIPILAGSLNAGEPYLPLISSKQAVFDTSGNGEVSFGSLGADNTLSGKYFTFYGRIKYDASDNDFDYVKTIFRFDSDQNLALQLLDRSGTGNDNPNMVWRAATTTWSEEFDNISFDYDEGVVGNPEYFFLYSINDGLASENAVMSLFIINLETGEYQCEEVDQDYEQTLANITQFTLGDNIPGYDYSLMDCSYSQLQGIRYRYYDANSEDDINTVYNIASFMPAFDEMIGVKKTDGSVNNNISFDKTEEIRFKEFKGMVKWTDVNYSSFPDLFYKRVREPVLKIMSAPSFLQFEYQNTFIIFTRNSINRFVLEGSADGWSGSSSALIEEKTQYGLLAPKSLIRAGDALFWLSEVGVMMWTSEGVRLISKDIVDIPIGEDVIGFYNNLKNQYVLHRNLIEQDGTNQSITYIFQIDRNSWSKYTGLDIVSASGLTGGSQLDNINLFLDSDGAIKKYPTSTTTSVESLIQTKEMFFEKGTLRRIKAGFEGDDVDFTSYMKKNDGNGSEITKTNTITSIESNKWRGISLANSRGKAVSFEVKNADKIEKIMYDLKIESEVVV